MADTPEREDFHFSPLGLGAAQGPTEAPPPERGFGGWAKDTAIDLGRGAVGMARSATGAKAAISAQIPGSDPIKRQSENLSALEDVDTWMASGKTETAQYRERHADTLGWADHPVGKATETVAGIVPYLPLAFAGPLGAAAGGGAFAYGSVQSDLHKRIRDASEEDLSKVPDYQQYRSQGMDDQAARDQLFVDGSDPTKGKNLLAAIPAVVGNFIGGGVGGVMLNKMTQRTINDAIVSKVLRNLGSSNLNNAGIGNAIGRRAAGAIEAGVGGGLGMGGSEWSRQQSEVNVGLRDEVDTGEVLGAAGEGAAAFGAIGAVGGVRQKQQWRSDIPLPAWQGRKRPTPYAPEGAPPPTTDGRPLAGELGDENLNVARAQGKSGPDGPQGPQGPEGPDGPYDHPLDPRPGPRMPPGYNPDDPLREYGPRNPGPPSPRDPHGEYGPRGPEPYDQPPNPNPEPKLRGRVRPERYGPPEPYGPREETPTHTWPDVTRPGEEPFVEGPSPPPFNVPQPGAPRPERYDPNRPFAPRDVPETPDDGRGIGQQPLDPHFPDTNQPGKPRPGEFGGDQEVGLSYPDRARLRAELRGMDPQTRGRLADAIERALDHGTRPSIPMRGAEYVEHLMQASPRGVVAELRRGIEPHRMAPEHETAVASVRSRATPEQARGWADEIRRVSGSDGRPVMWNRLSKSMRDALGQDRAAVVDALRRFPHEVADVLAGRERGYREALGRDAVEQTATRTHEDPHARQDQPRQEGVAEEFLGRRTPEELAAEGQAKERREAEGRLTNEYGEPRPVSTEKPFLRGAERRRNKRPGTNADLGLTRTGRFAPGTEAVMSRVTGKPLSIKGPKTETRIEGVLRRAAERRAEREAARDEASAQAVKAAEEAARSRKGPLSAAEIARSRGWAVPPERKRVPRPITPDARISQGEPYGPRRLKVDEKTGARVWYEPSEEPARQARRHIGDGLSEYELQLAQRERAEAEGRAQAIPLEPGKSAYELHLERVNPRDELAGRRVLSEEEIAGLPVIRAAEERGDNAARHHRDSVDPEFGGRRLLDPEADHSTRRDREHRERVAQDEAEAERVRKEREAEDERLARELPTSRIRGGVTREAEISAVNLALQQIVGMAADARRVVSDAFKRLIEHNPRVSGIAERAVQKLQRKASDAKRKENRRQPDYIARERAIEATLRDGHAEYLDSIEKQIGNETLSRALRTPTGTVPDVSPKRAKQWQIRDRKPEMIKGDEHEDFEAGGKLSNAAKEDLLKRGRLIADQMEARLRNVQDELLRTRDLRTEGGRKKSLIPWGLSRNRGTYTWYGRVADVVRYSSALRRMVGDSNTPITPQKLSQMKPEAIRGAMTNIWLREKMIAENRYSDLENMTNEKHEETVSWLEARANRLQGILDHRREGMHNVATSLDEMQESGRSDSKLESEIRRILQILEGMKEFSGKDKDFDPVDYETAMLGDKDPINDALYRDMSEFHRGLMMAWAQRYREGIPEHERVERRREEQRIAQDSAQRRIAHEQPQEPTRQQRLERVKDLRERMNEINEELDALPPHVPEGPGHDAAMRLQTEQQEALHDELIAAENEARDLATKLNPELLQDEYGLGRVLDPAGDMTDQAHLPKGATARPLSDYVGGVTGTQTAGGGAPVRERMAPTGVTLRLKRNEGTNNLTNHYLDVVHEVAGDTTVVRLTSEQMGLALQEKRLPGDTPAFYDRATHRIFIDRAVFRDPERARQVLMHEFGHPMTEVAIERFPAIARRIDAVRRELSDRYYDRHSVLLGGEYTHPEIRAALGDDVQALTNVHEFLSHLYSNPRLEAALSLVDTPPGMERPTARKMNRLNRLMHDLLKAIRLGFGKVFWQTSKKKLLNEATINSLDLFESVRKRGRQRPTPQDIVRPMAFEEAHDWAGKHAADAKTRIGELGTYLSSGDLPMQFRTMSDMERIGSGGIKPLTKVISQIADRINASARRHEQNPEIEEIGHRSADLERVNKRAYDELMDYQAEATHWQVHGADPLGEGRNAHVGDKTPKDLQMREAYPELKARWDRMTDVQKDLWRDMQKSYDAKHEAVLHATLGPIVDVKKMIPDGAPSGVRARLIRYILDGDKDLTTNEKGALMRFVPGYDPADTALHAHFTKDVRDLRANAAFRRLPIWSPAMREGKYVVEARFDLSQHAHGGSQIERPDGKPSGQFEFNTAAERDAMIRRVAADDRYKGVRLTDEGTSEIVYAKDDRGGILRDAEGKPVPLTELTERTRRRGDDMEPGFREETENVAQRVKAKDAGNDGITRYRVSYNPLLLEFHERQMDAQNRHAELQQAHHEGYLKLSDTQPIRDFKNTYVDPTKMDVIQRQLQDSITNSKGWREMDATTRAMVMRDMQEAAVRTMASQTARAAKLQRTFALGARKNMVRDFVEYHRKTAHTLAGLEHRSELSDAFKAMDHYVDSTRHWAGPNDPQGKFGIVDNRIRKSLRERMMREPEEYASSYWSKGLTAVLRLSYLDKLMSPMFTVLQAIEPWVVMAPALAGQHGFKAYPEIWRAMRDLQGGSAMAAGFGDAGRTLMAGPAARLRQTDLVGRLKESLRNDPEALAHIEHMENHSQLDRNAGMELQAILDPSKRWGGRPLDWADHMTRQVNSQIEGVNRAAFGLAAFRLARREHGKSMAEAHEISRQMVHEMAGNYNAYASAPIFNNPYFRPALQFKRYAQRMTMNWGRTFLNAGLALVGKLPEEHRAAAYRQLAFMMGTTLFTSGFLGMPTEPLKAVINLTQGVTGYNADDMERMAYEGSMKLMGPELGEFIAKGGFRAAGLGLGQRTGYDTMWSNGSIGKRPSDWWQAAGHYLAGAPGAYAVDVAQGIGSAANAAAQGVQGHGTEAEHSAADAIEKIFPVKVVADTIVAARRYMGGPSFRTQSGLPLGVQPSLVDTAAQAFGVQTARMQRAGEKRAAMKDDMRKYTADKKEAETIYANAAPRERVAIQRELLDGFNSKYPEMQPLTIADLFKAQRRFAARETADPSMLGVTMTRRQQALLPRYENYRVN